MSAVLSLLECANKTSLPEKRKPLQPIAHRKSHRKGDREAHQRVPHSSQMPRQKARHARHASCLRALQQRPGSSKQDETPVPRTHRQRLAQSGSDRRTGGQGRREPPPLTQSSELAPCSVSGLFPCPWNKHPPDNGTGVHTAGCFDQHSCLHYLTP